MGTPVRVLIVDDSAVMRQLLSTLLSADPEIEVVGTAPDPHVARERIKALNPDVITLDVEMPHMDGVTFLRKIMTLRPMPVVMISTLTQAGAEITLEALEIGAVDFVAKPTSDLANAMAGAGHRIADQGEGRGARARRHAPRAAVPPRRARNRATLASRARQDRRDRRVDRRRRGAQGRADGPAARLPADPDHPAHAAALHRGLRRAPQSRMPDDGVGSHARRGHRARPCLYRARARTISNFTAAAVATPAGCRRARRCPAIGRRSTCCSVRRRASPAQSAVGVILTGMGKDGAEGLLEMRQAGAATLGQDEESSLIYGMPRVAFERGGVMRQYPLGADGRRDTRRLRRTRRIASGRSAASWTQPERLNRYLRRGHEAMQVDDDNVHSEAAGGARSRARPRSFSPRCGSICRAKAVAASRRLRRSRR